MKILIITRHPVFELIGGVQEYVKTLANNLAKRKEIKKIYIASSAISFENRYSNKINFVRLGKGSYRSLEESFPKLVLFYIDFLVNGFLELKKIILSNKNKLVIHSNEAAILAFILLPFKFLFQIPIVTTLHVEGWYGFSKLQKERKNYGIIFTPILFVLEKIFLMVSDKIILVDETLKNFYKKFLSKIKVIYNPIDYNKFKPNKKLRKLWRKKLELKNNLSLLFLGRLSEEKGIKELLTIFLQIIKKYPKIKLVIVGDGPLKNFVLKFLDYYPNKLIYVGKTNTPEVFYNACDILFFYSKFEERSRVIPEALGCGMTILATPTREIFKLKNLNPTLPIFLIPKSSKKIFNFLVKNLALIENSSKIRKQRIIEQQDASYTISEIFKIYENTLNIYDMGNIKK